MNAREKLRRIEQAIAVPFQRMWCLIRCRNAGAQWDPNVHRWSCRKCGCNWGDE